MASTFTWLHLTDLHIGQPRHEHSPEQIVTMLVDDLDELRKDRKLAAPDVVFFTGDLAYSGREYDKLETFLGKVWKRFADKGWKRPLLAPVPGNHDLSWQTLTRDELVLWRHFHDEDDVREQLFASLRGGAAYWLRDRLDAAFSGYTGWLGGTRIPLVARRPGILPGEYTATWEEGDVRLGIVGLNSAYYDLPDVQPRPGAGGLALYPAQLDDAVGPAVDFDTWCAQHDACIALTHHPPAWLAERGSDGLKERYFTEERVALHLCGHVHEASDAGWGSGWDAQTRIFLGRSLFGVEKVGAARGGTLERSFGYALGQLRFTAGSAAAELVVYPRRAVFERGKMLIRPDEGTGAFTMALKTQTVPVHPRSKPKTPSMAPPPPPSKRVYLRPIFGEIVAELTAASPSRPGGIFLFAPTRYGATTLVEALLSELSARRSAVREGPEAFAVVAVHLRAWAERGLDANQIERLLCQTIVHRALDAEDDRRQAPTDTLQECVEHVLSKRRDRTVLLLVLEAFRLLPPDVNGAMQARLRTALENNKYTSSTRRGLRLLVMARAPASRTFAVNQAGSLLLPALHLRTLGPLSIEEALECAHRRAAWQGHDDLCRWLWRHTGGHPELFICLCEALAGDGRASLPLGDVPASDAERASWLHGPACPVKQEVDALAETMRAVIERDAARLPAPYGTLAASAAPELDLAVAMSGLFLAGSSPVAPIPFVARVLAPRG